MALGILADRVFAAWDTDHNGSLSLDEFVSGLTSVHLRGPDHSDEEPLAPILTAD